MRICVCIAWCACVCSVPWVWWVVWSSGEWGIWCVFGCDVCGVVCVVCGMWCVSMWGICIQYVVSVYVNYICMGLYVYSNCYVICACVGFIVPQLHGTPFIRAGPTSSWPIDIPHWDLDARDNPYDYSMGMRERWFQLYPSLKEKEEN